MERAIKFRAWDGTKMWKCAVPILGNAYNGGTINASNQEDGGFNSFISGTLMQFTGLHDCEGKEIWEGDLLSNNFKTDKEVIRQVLFHNGSWIMKRIKGNSKLKNEILLFEYSLLNFKVIGNLYEHLHLLNNESNT